MKIQFYPEETYRTKNGEEFDPWKTNEAKINLKLAGGYEHYSAIRYNKIKNFKINNLF